MEYKRKVTRFCSKTRYMDWEHMVLFPNKIHGMKKNIGPMTNGSTRKTSENEIEKRPRWEERKDKPSLCRISLQCL
jgi:hypothetical protein